MVTLYTKKLIYHTVALRHEKTPFRKFFLCAEGETRTLKSLRSQHFECCMVTNFITPAIPKTILQFRQKINFALTYKVRFGGVATSI